MDTYDLTVRDSYAPPSPPPTGLIPQTGWSLLYVDSEELVYVLKPATAAYDGNPGT